MPIPRLSEAEIAALLQECPGWRRRADGLAIERQFAFGDFAEAFAFMTRIAIHAEKADHHPEWSNVYNRVAVTLTTHDAGGISARDAAMARAIGGML